MEQFLGLPPDGSAHGPGVDYLIVVMHWLMVVLFVGWGAFYVYTLIRFSKKRNPTADYKGVKSHISTYLEVTVAVVEIILLVGFSIPLWSQRVDAFPAEKDATVVRVVAEQFAWNVHYPGPDGVFGRTNIKLVDQDNPLGLDRTDPAAKDDIATINQLNLPVGKSVIIHLSSKDVIHSLNLPLYRVKQDAIPGMEIPVWFTPTKTTAEIRATLTKKYSLTGEKIPPILFTEVAMENYVGKDDQPILSKGDFIFEETIPQLRQAGITSILASSATPTEIACAQLCGLGHYRMRGYVTVQTKEEFDAWVVEQEVSLAEMYPPESTTAEASQQASDQHEQGQHH